MFSTVPQTLLLNLIISCLLLWRANVLKSDKISCCFFAPVKLRGRLRIGDVHLPSFFKSRLSSSLSIGILQLMHGEQRVFWITPQSLVDFNIESLDVFDSSCLASFCVTAGVGCETLRLNVHSLSWWCCFHLYERSLFKFQFHITPQVSSTNLGVAARVPFLRVLRADTWSQRG